MKIALSVAYNGASYHGFQKQLNLITIQDELENAISKVANEQIQIFCAGRTDAGVHATNQIIHFETNVQRKLDAWKLGVSHFLPKDIAVNKAYYVGDDFHARFKAVSRHYKYIIYNSNIRVVHMQQCVTWYFQKLNHIKMQEAGKLLLGTHDFSSFRAAGCQAKTPIKTIIDISLHKYGDMLIMDIQADAFLHHMVRNIVGSLLLIGIEEKPVVWMQELLLACDRKYAGATAMPNGLYLTGVHYPHHYNIDNKPISPWFIV